jgi:hypothetical protein
MMDWLQGVGMVVNSLKTEAMYLSKYDQVGLEIQLASSEIQVGTTMRVLGVMFDSKLSWGSHITNISNFVRKKIHALRKISTDLNPSELLGIAHGSIYSVLYYAAGTWLKEDYKKNTSEYSKYFQIQHCGLYLGRGHKNAALWNHTV